MKDAGKLLNEMRKASEEGESLRDLVRCCLHEFKGPAGIAKELRRLFDAPKQTAANQTRILSDIIKIWMSVEGAGVEEEDVSEEDVEAQLQAALDRQELPAKGANDEPA